MKDSRIKAYNRIILTVHFLFSAGLSVYRISDRQFYLALLASSSFLLLLVPHIFFKLLGYRPIPHILTISYLYCILSFTIGMALQAYHLIPLYDKAVHTVSGYFFAFLGLICYSLAKPDREILPGEFRVAALFTFSFSMMIAAVWEIYEYLISLCSTLDPQNVRATGIHDTMQDIIVCLLGALLFLIPEYLYYKKGKKYLFMSCYEAFCTHKNTPVQ